MGGGGIRRHSGARRGAVLAAVQLRQLGDIAASEATMREAAAVDARQVAFGAHVVKEDDVAGVEAEVWMRDELPMNNRPHVNGGGRNLQNQDSKHLASASCHQGSNREQ